MNNNPSPTRLPHTQHAHVRAAAPPASGTRVKGHKSRFTRCRQQQAPPPRTCENCRRASSPRQVPWVFWARWAQGSPGLSDSFSPGGNPGAAVTLQFLPDAARPRAGDRPGLWHREEGAAAACGRGVTSTLPAVPRTCCTCASTAETLRPPGSVSPPVQLCP